METQVWLLTVLGSVCSGLCFLAYAVPIVILGFMWQRRIERAYQSLINAWAQENRWVIIRRQRCAFIHPWLITPKASQRVYFLTVTYQDGRPYFRRAWIRCGGRILRQENAEIEVSWEEGLPQPLPPAAPEAGNPREDPLWDEWFDSPS
jgi:hypothetical protein